MLKVGITAVNGTICWQTNSQSLKSRTGQLTSLSTHWCI